MKGQQERTHLGPNELICNSMHKNHAPLCKAVQVTMKSG